MPDDVSTTPDSDSPGAADAELRVPEPPDSPSQKVRIPIGNHRQTIFVSSGRRGRRRSCWSVSTLKAGLRRGLWKSLRGGWRSAARSSG